MPSSSSSQTTIYGLCYAILTPPFLGGFSAEVCEISPHNSDFLNNFFDVLYDGKVAL